VPGHHANNRDLMHPPHVAFVRERLDAHLQRVEDR
jgi:hypothetical protein